eukprot:CAMPEP_0174234814 /NCGR_PEP_ID=MMETSP0417-20130205/4453_1 /TAXON_ID=242541 /ORGANISM="Mayorella sp, Strain BSH-02190019" /LENGTH=1117 /DNA_ID=CAMNT_0015313229 /DNA_START=45 /DNA_END=3398 /DNA_ORIENTATION=-
MAAHGLNENEVAEIKKAFSMCDSDGSGSIDASELRNLMRAVTNSEVTDAELSKVMNLVDVDRSGSIELEEFVAAIGSWLGGRDGATSPQMLGKRRKRAQSGQEEREEVHKKIKAFFQQEKRQESLDEVTRDLQKEAIRQSRREGNVLLPDSEVLDSHQKLEVLAHCKRVLTNVQPLIADLGSQSITQQVEGVKSLASLLYIVEAFPTPIERRRVVDVIVKIFEMIVQLQVVPRLVQFLRSGQAPLLQYHAARCLTMIAAGPRIAGTPDDSVLAPKHMFFKKLVMSEGVVPVFVSLLSAAIELREQAVVALGTLAANDPPPRDFLLQQGVIGPLVQLVRNDAPRSLMRKLSWTLSVLCGVTHPRERLPNFQLIVHALPRMAELLIVYDDEEVVRNLCAAMSLILPGVPDPNVCERLVVLLTSKSVPAQLASLETVEVVVRLDERQANYMLERGLITSLHHCLRSADVDVRRWTLRVLCAVAGPRRKIRSVLENGELTVMLLQLVNVDQTLRAQVVHLLRLLSAGSAVCTTALVQKGIVKTLTGVLQYFKEYDEVLSRVYKFSGPSYNFDMATDAVGALLRVVNMGESIAEETGKLNSYALQFDLACIDRFRDLLVLLGDTKDKEIASWRQLTEGDKPLEEYVRSLLSKVRRSHAKNPDPRSQKVAEMIGKVWREYEKMCGVSAGKPSASSSGASSSSASSSSSSAVCASSSDTDMMNADKLLLTCYYRGETFVDEIPRSFTYDQLRERILTKYGKNIVISYKDGDDVVRLDNQLALTRAIEHFSSQRTLKLLLKKDRQSRKSKRREKRARRRERRRKRAAQRKAAKNAMTTGEDGPAAVEELSDSESSSSSDSDSDHSSSDSESDSDSEDSSDSEAASSSRSSRRRSRKEKRKKGFKDLAEKVEKRKRKKGSDGKGKEADVFPMDAPLGDVANFSLSGDLAHLRRQEKKSLFERLAAETHFGRAELEAIHSKWSSQATDGLLTREQFAEGMKEMGVTDPLLIEQQFLAFDEDGDGTVSFLEFCVGLSVLQRGSIEERLQFMFKAYDVDNSGDLSPQEVFNLYKATLNSRGRHVSDAELQQYVKDIFAVADLDNSGGIDVDEFIMAVKQQKLFLDLFEQ